MSWAKSTPSLKNDQQNKPHLWNRTNPNNNITNSKINWNTKPIVQQQPANTSDQQTYSTSAYFHNKNVLNSTLSAMATPQQQTVDTKFADNNINKNNNNNNDGWNNDWNNEWDNNNSSFQQNYAPQPPQNYQTPPQNFGYGQHTNQSVPPPNNVGYQAYPQNYGQQQQQPQSTFSGYQQSQNFNQQANYAPPVVNQNVISDSFSQDSNWNWNVEQPLQQAQFPKVSPEAAARKNSETTGFDSQTANIPRLPDIPGNTQQPQQQLKANPQMNRVLKSDTLTPQCSIESQSSDPSMDSENIESRSSNTVTSDEAGNIPSVTTFVENRVGYMAPPQQFNYAPMQTIQPVPPPVAGDMDQLDVTLQAINLGAPPVQQNFQSFYGQSAGYGGGQQQNIPQTNYQEPDLMANQQNLPLPPPPPVKDQSFVQQEQMFPPQSQIPPPLNQPQMKYPSPVPSPANIGLMSNSRPSSTPSSASSMQFAPPPAAAVIAGPPPPTAGRTTANPYKRTSAAAHHSLNVFQPPSTGPVKPNDFFQQETLAPDNAERPENLENLDDRNQYLQTGHLSEQGYSSNHTNDFSSEAGAENLDFLPPPGASRLVPVGQPEPNNEVSSYTMNDSLQEPPPGLDRLIPGTELPNEPLNMERQADGQVSSGVPQIQRVFTVPTTTSTPSHVGSNLEMHDRNLYLVAGGSNESQPQRVIPGVEDEQNSTTNFVQPMMGGGGIPINEQQRELVMDGENLEDQVVQQQQLVRDEQLIEGENALDEPQPPATMVGDDTDLNSTQDHDKKGALSIPSLDDSDRDRRDHHYNLPQRRGEEKRTKGLRNSREKYDSADSEDSDRDKRHFRRETNNWDSRREDDDDRRRENASSRRGDRTRDSRDFREGEKDRRDRGTTKSSREKDRYRGDRYRDRDRYETDGSKYETERSSKYDDSRRRDDRRGTEDGKRRKDDRYYDKSDRRRDERYRSDRRSNRSRHDFDEDYQRSSSRNASDRERDYGRNSRDRELREKERNKYSSAGYYQQQTAGYTGSSAYDAYAYYQQHQQYFETLRRTNPQAYSEWYRTYYGQMQAAQLQQQHQRDLLSATDGRESVPSGRSSANEKDRYSRPQHFYNPDYNRQYGNYSLNSTMLEPTALRHTNLMPNDHHLSLLTYQQQEQRLQKVASTEVLYAASLGGGDRSYYSENDFYSQRAEKLENQKRRLTPCKFTTSHSVGNWQNGLMALVKPRYSANGFTDVVKIINVGVNDSIRKLFASYPGPLVRNVTHKKSIIEFCEEQIRLGPMTSQSVKSRGNSLSSLHSGGQQPNRGSFTLVWDYLILLLRQNGTFVGADISELLMKNKLEYPYEMPDSVQNQNSRRTSVEQEVKGSEALPGNHVENAIEDDELSKDDPDKNDDTTDEDVDDLSKEKSQLSEKEITDKFRNYLLYGNIAEALEWATENNLWGHALFLASKVDRRQHANVMMKFANKLTLNDPLQTLYQLMSGRSPNSVTSIIDEKWGDWRPHLAMILSNTSEKVDLSRKAITTLGDTLYNRGDLFAAQFCYLVADISFGKWSNVNQETATISNSPTAVRLVLLGASQHKCFKEFATNEAIIMTEIYEYARTLNDEKFTINDFQPYKYLLSTRLLDYGQQLKSLLYVEQIALKIKQDSSNFEPSFIQKVYALGDRLKYFDPVIEKIIDESLLDDNNTSATGNVYQSVKDQQWLQDLATVLRNYNSGALTYEPIPIQNSVIEQPLDVKSQIDQQFVELNNQFTELTTQYESYTGQEQAPVAPVPMYGQNFDQQTSYPEQLQQQQQPQSFGHVPYYGQPVVESEALQQPQQQQYETDYGQTDYNHYAGDGSQSQTDGFGQQSYDAWNQQSSETLETMELNSPQPCSLPYDGLPAPADNSEQELPKPQISMPNSMSNKSGFYEDGTSGGGASGGKEEENSNKTTANNSKKPVGAKDGGKGTIGANGPNSSGWFGGIFNKFSLKPKNQMILPDDKNPSIVWDPEKKKWVNTDGESEEQEAFKPPPKMSQLPNMMQQQPMQAAPPPQTPPTDQYQHQPPQFGSQPQVNNHLLTGQKPSLSASGNVGPQATVMGDPGKIPTLQSNSLRMQRKRTLKNSYVDVFNPSGAPAKPIEPILAPALPQTTQIPTQGYFIPAPAAGPSEHQSEGGPQFYDPNQFSGYQQ